MGYYALRTRKADTLTNSPVMPWVDGVMLIYVGGRVLRIFGWNNRFTSANYPYPGDPAYSTKTTINEVWDVSDPLNCFKVGVSPAEPRHNGGVWNLPNGKCLIAGGDNIYGWLRDSWIVDASNTWTQTSADWGSGTNEIGNCILQASCTHKGIPLFAGGQKTDNPAIPVVDSDFNNSLFKTVDEGSHWVKVSDLPEGLRNRATMRVESVGNVLVFLGGAVYPLTNNIYYTDVWVSYDDGVTITYLCDLPEDFASGYATTGVLGNDLFYMRGYHNGANRAGLWYSSDLGRNWKEILYNPIAPNHASAMIKFYQKLRIVHGNEQQGIYDIVRLGN